MRLGKTLACLSPGLQGLLIAQFLIGAQPGHAAVFTNNALIAETDLTYDGQDVVVSSATLTVNGTHAFNSLLLTNGAVLTHSPCTATETHKLDLLVTNTLAVSSDSRIDVSGKGYLPGRTTGNTRFAGYEGTAGGSFGGLGLGGPPVYGDYSDPNDWGSGSGTFQDRGSPGGGLVRISAHELILDGLIEANAGFYFSGVDTFGEGAGGGISIKADVITGLGTIRANARLVALSPMNAGGGGRIALYARDFSNFNVARITAHGGQRSTQGGPSGGAGTVYVRDTDELFGRLFIENINQDASNWTPLIAPPGASRLVIPDMIIIRGPGTRVRVEPADLEVVLQRPVLVEDSAYFFLGNNFLYSSLTATRGGVIDALGPFHVQGPLILTNGGRLQVTGTFMSAVPFTLEGGRLTVNRVVAPELILTNGALLTTYDSTPPQVHRLELHIAGSLLIDSSSRIDVSGKGYAAGRTTGNLPFDCGGCGGSHGGIGGGASPSSVYGDYAYPEDFGGASGTFQDASAPGGGAIFIFASQVVLNGSIVANGLENGAFYFGGGGAGGSILIGASTIAGGGHLLAVGGGGAGATGGGGRIAVYAQDYSGLNTNRISAQGGGRPRLHDANHGGVGTVHLAQGPPHTHVRWHAPAGLNTGHVSNVLSSVSLHFNKAINTNLFSASRFVIDGQMGRVQPTALTQTGDRIYRVDFSSLSENGPYHFTVLPNLLDAEGFPLDQNANGIAGEPEDAYSFTLIVDTVAPRVVQHAPAGDQAGTVTSLSVWLTEKIDKAQFTAAEVSFRDPSGNLIAVSSIQEIGFNRFRIGFAPQTAFGTYQIRIGPNVLDLAGNPLDQDRDQTFGEADDDVYSGAFNIVPLDLELSNVTTSSNRLFAGDFVTVAWNGRNATGAPLLGDWIDAVYLSKDDRWDIDDSLLTLVPHVGGLASNEIYSAGSEVVVPGVLPGNYYVLVRADIANVEREMSETNNIVAFGPVPVVVRQLPTDGAIFTGNLTSNNRSHYFAVYVPGGESLRLNLTGSAGVNHLFVTQSAIPTTLSYDQGSMAGGPNQTVILTGVSGGATYYVVVYANQVATANPYGLVAEMRSFFITSISPNRLSAGRPTVYLSPGCPLPYNIGYQSPFARVMPATLSLAGSGFDAQTQVELIGSDGIARPAAAVQHVSATLLTVNLDLGALPPDNYDVRTVKGATSYIRPDALTIDRVGTANLQTRLIVPSAMSPGFPVRQTLWIEYENHGNGSMFAPLLKVTADQGALLSTDADLATTLRATSRVPPSVTSHVQVMATGSGATPGILQPGDRGRIPVYYLGLPRDTGASQVTFSLSQVTADDVTWHKIIYISPISIPGQPCPGFIAPPVDMSIGWYRGTLKEDLRPESVPPGAWDIIWSNLAMQIGGRWPEVGPEWGFYVQVLAENMNHLAAVGQSVNDPAALFNFEIGKASGILNPIRNLASAVDASAPSPGFPLVFRRVYGQPIPSRFRIGPLGRGWTHNWDISLQSLTNGNVIVHGPGGADRFFTLTPGIGYQPSPGDYGELLPIADGFQLRETDKTIWKFRADFRLNYVEDSNANRITCGYTGSQLTSLTHSSGRQFILDYDGNGRLWHLTDPLGPGPDDDRLTTYEYAGEHLMTVTAPGNRITRYGYDTTAGSPRQHALRSVEYPDLRHDYFDYDERGRLRETHADGGAQQVTYSYDSAGNVTVEDQTGRKTILSYGIGGQLAQVRDGEGRLVNFNYTNSQLSQLLGPGGERYRYGYDAKGNLSAIQDPLRQPNSFQYEATFNRLSRVTDARGHGLGYSYDSRGNLTAIAYADSTRETFGYDTRGNVVTSTNRRGGVINYRYNSDGQLTNKFYLTGTGRVDYFYLYDTAANLRSAAGPEGATLMDYYPETDRLRRIEYPGAHWFEFGYDDASRRASRVDQDGHRTHYVYDAVGRLDLMTNELGQLIVDYEYDPAGRLQRKTLGNGVFTTYQYNSAGQILSLTNSRPDGSLLSSYNYDYDASGRRTAMRVARGYAFPPGQGEGADTQLYGYDALGQLTRVEYGDGRVVEYIYDGAGNRSEVKDNGASTIYTPNALNQYMTAGDETLLYDADGNLTNRHSTLNSQLSTSYTYDIENRLIGVATLTNSWSYIYDTLGNRTAAAHNGEQMGYLIDPIGLGNVAAEIDGAGNLIARYEHGFGLLSRIDSVGTHAHYTFSAIGHASELSDATGEVANAYAYDPAGASLAQAETLPNPFEFVGEFGVTSDGSGLPFMRARFYEPHWGRFIHADPIGVLGGQNLYSYVGNRFSSLIDPLGTSSFDVGANGTLKTPDLSTPPTFGSYTPYDFGPILEEAGFLATYVYSIYKVATWWKLFKPPALIGLLLTPQPFGGGEDGFSPLPGTPYLVDSSGYLIPGNPFFVPQGPQPISPLLTPDEDTQDTQVNVVRSRDPNDKLAPAGYGASAFVRADSALIYQIRFENQPSATAPAQKIIITDTLDSNLDLSTFELTEITFADQIISVPMGLNHYEARLPFTAGTNSILADVQAALNVATRRLTLTLQAVDPATGWFPEDPLTGLLYPNDATGRGEGSISYVIKPLSGLPSGTQIRNRASIVFDFNDPIETPQVFNTIDSGPPTSAVTALPAEAGPAIFVQWSGQDDAGGAGVASYDIHVIADGTNEFRWLENTTATSAYFSGVLGSTYAFYSIARDHVGNTEIPPVAPDAQTFVPTNAPVLNLISNQVANVGDVLTITNTATGTPVGSFTFSLGPYVPFGVRISPISGVLHWTPNCAQASRANLITVWVTDSGNPNLRDAMTFEVVTRECVVPQLGRLILRAGDSGRVPVNLISSVALTGLTMTVEVPADRVAGLSLETIIPEICASSILPLSNSLHQLTFTTCSNQFLIGTQQIAWLHFSTIATQSSAFVKLTLDNTVGLRPDGTEARNFAAQAGRLVIIAEEPLLEATVSGTGQRTLVLYAPDGTTNVVESTLNLGHLMNWQPAWEWTMTNLFEAFENVAPGEQTIFYRARRR